MTMVILVAVFALGFTLHVIGRSAWVAWLLSGTIMPVCVLAAEFLVPYSGGGASFWPIALLFGSIYGVIVGGTGVLAAAFFLRWKRATAGRAEIHDA